MKMSKRLKAAIMIYIGLMIAVVAIYNTKVWTEHDIAKQSGLVKAKDNNGDYKRFEANREGYEKQITEKYSGIVRTEKSKIMEDIDNLLVEYEMLRDLVILTDNYVFTGYQLIHFLI